MKLCLESICSLQGTAEYYEQCVHDFYAVSSIGKDLVLLDKFFLKYYNDDGYNCHKNIEHLDVLHKCLSDH